MPEAQFIPGGNPAGSIIGGLDAGMSMMERAQAIGLKKQQAQIAADANARAEQEQSVAMAREVALRPVRALQDKVNIAKAGADLAGFAQTEQLRLDAQTVLPTARAAFDDTMRLGDAKERGQAALEWMGKYGHLSNLGELHNEFSAKNETAMNLVNHAQAMTVLRDKLNAADDQIRARGEAATATAIAKQQAKDEGAAELWKSQYGDAKLGDTVPMKDETGAPIPGIVGVLTKNGLQVKQIRAQAAEIQAGAEAKAVGQANVKANEGKLATGEEASSKLSRVKRALTLLDEGVRTGTAANLETNIKRIAEAAGIADTNAASYEELSAIMVQQAVSSIPQGQGAVSDYEREMFNNSVASPNKTPEGNRRILKSYEAMLSRQVEIAKIVATARAEGASEAKIRQLVDKHILGNPVITEDKADTPAAKGEKKVGRFTITEKKGSE